MAAAQTLHLIQLADIHLGIGCEHHLDNWRKVLAWAAQARPDVAIINGDMVMSDPDAEQDHVFARQEIGRIGLPCRFLPGNHDIGDNVVSGKMTQRVSTERLARYRHHYGDDRWSFASSGWTFIGVNAQLFGSDGMPEEATQWAWLEQTLRSARETSVALFTHKPLFLDYPGEPDSDDPTISQSCLDAASRARLLSLCHDGNVRIISTGHKHQTRTFSLDGIYHFWGPSTACVNGPPTALHWGTREVGFIDYRFHADGSFEHRIVGTDFLFRHENYIRKLAGEGDH